MVSPSYLRCATDEEESMAFMVSRNSSEKDTPSQSMESVMDHIQIKWWHPLLFHLFMFGIYTLAAVTLLLTMSRRNDCASNPRHSLVYSPANSAVNTQIQTKDNTALSFRSSPYSGNPSPENDETWRQLLRGYNLRVSHSDLERLNRTAIPLADGSGDHWGSLSMYHHLHCLKTIRHYIARDYYGDEFLDFTITPGQVYPIHIEHCIEGLRQYIMCQPDLTVWTLDWVDGDPNPKGNHVVEHECVDWDRLQNWVDDRSFSLHDHLIKRPDGTPWPGEL